MSLVVVTLAGGGVGIAYGVFGGGGSAFATPVLALIGVPPLVAVASPLPAMLPASLVGAHQYLQAGMLDRRIAKLAIFAGVPAVILGSAASRVIGGQALLAFSGIILFAIGLRMAVPVRHGAAERGANRRSRTGLVVSLVAGAAFLAGLLANGGGFLLVPIFVLALGFTAARAAGTSLIAAAALTIPTIAAHWLLGDINWAIAGAFAVGLVPASMVGARVGHRLPDHVTRPLFGSAMMVFAIAFMVTKFA